MNKKTGIFFWFSFCFVIGIFSSSKTGLASDEIIIGLLAPCTGPMASYGLTVGRGAEVGVDYINSQGGVLGKRLKLIIRDDQLKATTSVQMLQQMVYSENVTAVISAQSSGVYAACMPLIRKENIPYILAIPTSDNALDGMKSVFRITITSGQCVMKMTEYGVEAYKGKKLGLLGYEGPSGDEADKVAKEFCKKLGIGYVYVQQKYGGGEDLVAQAIKLRDSGADFIDVYTSAGDTAAFYRAIKKINWNIAERCMGSTTTSMPECVEVTGEFLPQNAVSVMPSPGIYSTDVPGVKRYLEAYKKKFGKLPNSMEDKGYDAVMIISEAIRKGGSMEKSKIIAAIEGFGKFTEGCNQFIFSKENHHGVKYENIDVIYFTRNPSAYGYGLPGKGVFVSKKYLK